MSKRYLREAFKELGILEKKEVNLKHAGASDHYFNVKRAIGEPMPVRSICYEFWELVPRETTVLAGSGTGAEGLVGAMMVMYPYKGSYIREKPKGHGLGSQIEGYVPKRGDKVTILDDVLTTGGTIKKVADVVRTTGAEVIAAVVVVNRNKVKDLDGIFVTQIFNEDELLGI